MHCTGVGKAMLSRLSGEFLEQYMARPMIRLTEHTITDPALLRREIDRVRRDGYALDDMELQIGITCVGVPLVDRKNRLQGALSVSGPSPRFDREKIQEIQVQLRAVAEDLSRLL
jgi:IclR family acetate operon transcriptional repressor